MEGVSREIKPGEGNWYEVAGCYSFSEVEQYQLYQGAAFSTAKSFRHISVKDNYE